MKKYLYIALIMVCGLASCDVLDTEPMDSYNELLRLEKAEALRMYGVIKIWPKMC